MPVRKLLWFEASSVDKTGRFMNEHRTEVLANVTKAVVPCQNKIILKNFRPEPLPSVDRPKIILFQHGTTSEMK